MPQQRKKEESESLRGERDQIKFIDLGFERFLYKYYLSFLLLLLFVQQRIYMQ